MTKAFFCATLASISGQKLELHYNVCLMFRNVTQHGSKCTWTVDQNLPPCVYPKRLNTAECKALARLV